MDEVAESFRDTTEDDVVVATVTGHEEQVQNFAKNVIGDAPNPYSLYVGHEG